MGSLSLLQRIFPTQESNQGVLHCRQILKQLSYQENPHLHNGGGGLVAKSCPTLETLWTVCSLPGFSVHGISQSKILEWLTISLSRASSQPKDCLLPWQADSLALNHLGFSDSSTGKESACNAGDPGSTPGF